MNRVALLYLASYALSFLGNSVAAVVLPLVVLQTTGSPLDAALVAAATALPAVLAGLLMGGVVDRYHRGAVSIVCDLVSGASVAGLALVGTLDGLTFAWFVVLGVVGSFGDVPGLTAREALLPAVVRSGDLSLDRLVGLRESIAAIAMVVGPAIAAGLVVVLDGTQALWVTAGLSLAAALVTVGLPRAVGAVTRTPGGASPAAALRQLREGWSLLFRRSPFLLSVTVLNLVLASVLTAIQGLLLPVHFTALGQEGRLGLVLSSLAAGMLLGSAVYAVWGLRLRRRTWLVTGLGGSVAGIGLIVTLPPAAVVLAGAFVLGTFGGIVSTVLSVLMTERIPDELRGRVTGTQNAVLTGAPSLGVVAAGVLIEHTSLSTAGLAVGATWLVAVAIALLVRPLRDLESVRDLEPGRPAGSPDAATV